MLICQIIRYNANDCPKKPGIFPQYKAPEAKKRYAQIAHVLYLGNENSTEDEKVELLLKAVADLKKELDIPASIREYGIDVARMRSARNAVDGVVRPGVRNPCRLVILEVPRLLVPSRLLHGRPVVDRVHRLHFTYRVVKIQCELYHVGSSL